jgi:uncharacterized protein
MTRTIYISLPVEQAGRAADFYAAIGFERDPAFSGENHAAMIWSDAIRIMLMQREAFAAMSPKRLIDPRTEAGALMALMLESHEAVDAMNAAAVAAGGRELHGAEDEGGVYSRAFEDPDGNGWGPFHFAAPAP